MTGLTLTNYGLGMGKIVNMHEAKTHFSNLAEQVEAGEEIIIARAGKPFMKLVSYTPPKRSPGGWEHLNLGDTEGLFDNVSDEIQAQIWGENWRELFGLDGPR